MNTKLLVRYKSLTLLSWLAIFLPLSTSSWSQEEPHPELLPKQSFEAFLTHAQEADSTLTKTTADLQLSAADERVLLHLPKRGFPHLAALLTRGNFWSMADSTLLWPDVKLPTCSREEDIADDLFREASVARVSANQYACFRLLKELAPSPGAMRVEEQAREFMGKINTALDPPTEIKFLEALESTRAFFDQLKGLPRMSPEEFARERAESAVLAPREYQDGYPDTRPWWEQRLDRQNHWDHEGFLVAYSESSGPEDRLRYQMVVKPAGGIFEAEQPVGVGSGSTFGPESYESKLPPADLRTLEDYLKKLPPSNANGKDIHFIISFSENGSWVTRTYSSLPEGDPFQPLLRRMNRQSSREWGEPPPGAEYLAPEQ